MKTKVVQNVQRIMCLSKLNVSVTYPLVASPPADSPAPPPHPRSLLALVVSKFAVKEASVNVSPAQFHQGNLARFCHRNLDPFQLSSLKLFTLSHFSE